MKSSSRNIKFTYLYRDGANYKQWEEIIFANKESIDLSTIRIGIHNCLIEGEWFDASKWQLRDLHFEQWDNEIDALLHEFYSVEETDELATATDISGFLILIEYARMNSMLS